MHPCGAAVRSHCGVEWSGLECSGCSGAEWSAVVQCGVECSSAAVQCGVDCSAVRSGVECNSRVWSAVECSSRVWSAVEYSLEWSRLDCSGVEWLQ